MDFDIVILGGGLVGASLLCALKEQDLRVALIDKAPIMNEEKAALDARALALSLTSVECLKMINIWPKMANKAFPILKIHVSKKGYFGSSILEAKPPLLPILGWVVNAGALNQAVNETVSEINNARIFRPEEILTLKKQNNLWQIQLSSRKRITAKLIVAADGTNSYFRQQQGIGIKMADHGQVAIVANIGLEQSHQGVAYERFTSEGSIAMLPFGDKQVKAVWIVPASMSERLKALEKPKFLSELQQSFGYRLGNLIQCGKQTIYPLQTMYSETIYGDQWVLIGNAANTLYPLAAQGFNLGLRDAAFLAEELAMAVKTRQDFSAISFLQRYASLRIKDHQHIREGTDALLDSQLIQWFGILACQWLGPLRQRVIKWGLGKQDTLPKLCRGISL